MGCAKCFACLSGIRGMRQLRINQAGDQWCLLCYLVSHFVSSALSPRFVTLRYERLFRFCNTLKHTWIQNFNRGGHSASYSYQLLQQIVFFNLNILETKNGIWESDEKQCGIFPQKQLDQIFLRLAAREWVTVPSLKSVKFQAYKSWVVPSHCFSFPAQFSLRLPYYLQAGDRQLPTMYYNMKKCQIRAREFWINSIFEV